MSVNNSITTPIEFLKHDFPDLMQCTSKSIDPVISLAWAWQWARYVQVAIYPVPCSSIGAFADGAFFYDFLVIVFRAGRFSFRIYRLVQ